MTKNSNKSIVVLQARTGSSRLRAKSLLTVSDIPMAILAAKRAANTGKKLLAVTSDACEDDYLSRLFIKNQIECFRGSLSNVLSRFVSALADYDQDDIVIRITADNIFPDGNLIQEVEDFFATRDLAYLACNGVKSGLPYGASVEVTRLKWLREAAKFSKDQNELEHVTPYLIHKFGATFYDKYYDLGLGGLRCTVDTYEDYINMLKIFVNVDDPINIPMFKLIQLLSRVSKDTVD